MTEKASHTVKPGGHLVPVALAQSPQSPKSLGTDAPKLVDTGNVSLGHWSTTLPFGRDLSHQTCPNKKNISAPKSQYFRVPRLMATADPRSSDAEKTSIPHFTAGGGPVCAPLTAARLGSTGTGRSATGPARPHENPAGPNLESGSGLSTPVSPRCGEPAREGHTPPTTSSEPQQSGVGSSHSKGLGPPQSEVS